MEHGLTVSKSKSPEDRERNRIKMTLKLGMEGYTCIPALRRIGGSRLVLAI